MNSKKKKCARTADGSAAHSPGPNLRKGLYAWISVFVLIAGSNRTHSEQSCYKFIQRAEIQYNENRSSICLLPFLLNAVATLIFSSMIRFVLGFPPWFYRTFWLSS